MRQGVMIQSRGKEKLWEICAEYSAETGTAEKICMCIPFLPVPTCLRLLVSC